VGKQSSRNAERDAHLAAVRAQQGRERRRTLVLTAVTATVVLVLAGGVTWAVIASRAPTVALTGLTTYSNLSRNHVQTTVNYPQTPPVGGDHSPVWQNCGVYPAPVANEHAVHSLEHGAIWITYRPDLAADQVAALRDDVKGQPYGLLSPYPGLPSPVVATVWGVQLKLQSATDPRLKVFIAKYADGTRAPEPQGECTGGIGTPLS
jgi:Protein of unknown function (DUF3105)